MDTTARRRPLSATGIAFSVAGIPVLVRWTHFIIVGLLLWPLLGLVVSRPDAIVRVLPILVMIPLAVLVHELGHAFAARWQGGRPRVELVFFGGLTYPSLPEGTGPGPRALVSFAGPAAGMAAGAIVWAVTGQQLGGFDALTAPDLFVWAALVWGGLNLVPLPGLDGGHVLDSVAELVSGPLGLRVAAVVKAITGVVVLVVAWFWGGAFAVLWILLVLGRTGLDEIRRGWEAPRTHELEAAISAFRRGRHGEARRAASDVLERTSDARVGALARQIVVQSAAIEEDWATVRRFADGDVDAERPLVVRALLAGGHNAEAEALARRLPGGAGRQMLAQALVAQDLGHLLEIGDRSEALALVSHAALLEGRGEKEVGRKLADEVGGRQDVAPFPRALALAQMGDRDRLRRVEALLTPEESWALGVETAGRTGDEAGLTSMLAEVVDPDAAATVQRRLHRLGHVRAAAMVGRRVLDEADPRLRPAVAYDLACSLARAGDAAGAANVLRSAFPDGMPDQAYRDPDLASLRRDGEFTTVEGRGEG